MQTQAMFYSIEEQSSVVGVTEAQLHLHYACLQAAYFYRQNQRVFIYTQDQQSAHDIDEMLWAFEPTSFVPHNLIGEGPKQGAAVEISWQAPTNRRAVLINLTSDVPTFAKQFSHLIDFVPSEDVQKEQARNRFRTCRQWGFNVAHQVANTQQTIDTTS